jgi:tol-pal system protein YbgF
MVRHQQEYLGLEPRRVTVGQSPGGTAGDEGKAVSVAVPKGLPPKEVERYDSALASFKRGNYEEAMGAFRAFLKSYPKSDRADNAHFWIGECHMALKQYEQAILAYQEVIKRYPNGNKVPNALLRQAIAFLEIKDETSTRLLLNRVIKDYPNSNEARIAKATLDNLK